MVEFEMHAGSNMVNSAKGNTLLLAQAHPSSLSFCFVFFLSEPDYMHINMGITFFLTVGTVLTVYLTMWVSDTHAHRVTFLTQSPNERKLPQKLLHNVALCCGQTLCSASKLWNCDMNCGIGDITAEVYIVHPSSLAY